MKPGILTYIADLFFPRTCHICGTSLIPGVKYICDACYSRLPMTGYHLLADNPMTKRISADIPVVVASAMFHYAPGAPISVLVHDFKYHNMPTLATRLGYRMGKQLFTTGFFTDTDLLIPIPLHRSKLMRRGYNQSQRLCIGISEATGIPVGDNLKAHRRHASQTLQSHEGRRSNVSGIFKVTNPETLRNRHIMLVDDVCTTGSTISEAARTLLKEVPGIRISVLTLALAD